MGKALNRRAPEKIKVFFFGPPIEKKKCCFLKPLLKRNKNTPVKSPFWGGGGGFRPIPPKLAVPPPSPKDKNPPREKEGLFFGISKTVQFFSPTEKNLAPVSGFCLFNLFLISKSKKNGVVRPL